MKTSYRGRFAPSPTGPLHMGSLFAAVVSYLHARAHQGEWLVRIEDIDPPREQKDAKRLILQTLEAHGFQWDGDVVYQSARSESYEQYLRELAQKEAIYRCPCSRKYLIQHNGIHMPECVKQQVTNLICAQKFKGKGASFTWQDAFQGEMNFIIEDDFVLKRKEGLYAYQLAVVADDIEQGITHVVRGSDLIESTPMQLALYRALNLAPPIFAHFPVIVAENHQKLSKQNLADAVDDKQSMNNLMKIFDYLGLCLPAQPSNESEALSFAINAWQQEPPILDRITIQQ